MFDSIRSARWPVAIAFLFLIASGFARAAGITLYVLEGGVPAENLVVRVDGRGVATTGPGGVALVELPDDARRVELLRDGSAVHVHEITGPLESTLVLTFGDVAANVAEEATTLDDLVVTGSGIKARGSVAAVLAEQRSSSEVTEIIGKDQFVRAGDTDAAAAVQRVTGLTIEDGKYVIVRGQPARYATTLWNGMPLPSPDPTRQIVPLDLFPTSVLTSIAVQKSYSVDQPGSFGAGVVALNSRQTPPESFVQLGAGTGANSSTTGRTGLDYRGSNGDVYGVDSGARELPAAILAATQGGQQSLDSLTQAERNELGKTFEPVYQLTSEDMAPNSDLSLSGGSQFDVGRARFGGLASVAWSNTRTLTEERDLDYRLATGNQLSIERDFQRTRSDLQAQMAGLGVLSAAWEGHTVASNTFFIRDTIKRSQLSVGHDDVSNDRFERGSLLEFNQRELAIQQLVGTHEVDGVKIDWAAQLADGERSSPDRREYKYIRQDTGDYIFWSEYGMRRQFNETSDKSTSFGLNVTTSLWESAVLALAAKAGASRWTQDRQSNTQRFRFEPIGNPPELALQNPEEIVNASTIGTIVDFFDDTQGVDDYAGDADIKGAYVQLDMTLWRTLRLVAGARQETAQYQVRTFESKDPGAPAIHGAFDENHLLPALSATWFISETVQVRATANETVSRPLLIELSSTTYVDPDSGLEYVGNPSLNPARIRSADLRWEWYPSDTESLAVGVFTKNYTDPIEQQYQPLAGGGEQITFINGGSARVAGLEFGGRATLGPLGGDWLAPAYLQGNLALIDSEVELNSAGIATNRRRPLQGQADTVINVQVGYGLGQDMHWVISYNRAGERLETAGVNGEPDTFQSSLSRLDLGWTYDATSSLELKLSASNLLDDKREYRQGGLTDRSIEPGISVSAGLSYSFFEMQ